MRDFTRIQFGNINMDITGMVVPKIVPMFISTLDKVCVSFELKNNDAELHVVYQAHVDADRVQESWAFKVLTDMSIISDLDTHEVIQHLGCTLSTLNAWKRKTKGLFEKRYIYRVEGYIVPKIADRLEEWRTFIGEPYVRGDVVCGVNQDTGHKTKLKIALT